MLEYEEVTPVNPDVRLPALPVFRLKDANSKWKFWAKVPLVMLFGVVATTLLSVFVPQLLELWNMLTLTLATLTFLTVVVLLVMTTRTRSQMKKELLRAATNMKPALADKYNLDVPVNLVGELITGSTLRLPVDGTIIRVGLRNVKNQTMLVKVN